MADIEFPYPQTLLETEAEAPDTSTEAGQKPAGLTAEQLESILAGQRKLSEDSLRQILSGSRPTVGPLQEDETFPDLAIDPVGLPHPSNDLEGFIKGWQERSNKVVQDALQTVTKRVTERAVSQATSVANNKSITDRAFDMIREAAPDIDEDVIHFASMQVANRYRAQGIDPMNALKTDLNAVAQEVLDYADERFGGRDAAPAPLQRRGNGSGGRTAGIAPGGGRLPRPAVRNQDDPGDMVAELKQFQHKARIY